MSKKQKENTATEESNRLVIEVSREGFTDEAIENLRKIIASKGSIIKKALGVTELPLDVTGDKLCFPWFIGGGEDGEADAYTRFVHALCGMAKRQKRVIATEKPVENEMFTMRVFLIRLGFIGEEYKAARKLLLKNLTGNGSWKNGQPPKKPIAAAE